MFAAQNDQAIAKIKIGVRCIGDWILLDVDDVHLHALLGGATRQTDRGARSGQVESRSRVRALNILGTSAIVKLSVALEQSSRFHATSGGQAAMIHSTLRARPRFARVDYRP